MENEYFKLHISDYLPTTLSNSHFEKMSPDTDVRWFNKLSFLGIQKSISAEFVKAFQLFASPICILLVSPFLCKLNSSTSKFLSVTEKASRSYRLVF